MNGRILTIAFILLATASFAQQKKLIDQGNQAFREGNYAKADSLYRLGRAADDSKSDLSAIARFNEGDALFRQERYDEAAQAFKEAASGSDNKDLQSRSFHNLGNSLLSKQDPGAAIDAYKQALRLNPNAEDTRYNLAYAMQMLQEQEQQQQGNDQNNDQNQDQQEQQQQQQQQDQEQNQQGQDEQNQEGEQQEQEQEGQNGQQGDDQKEQEGQQELQPYQISKEEAERMLEALNQREREIQSKLKKEKDGKRKKTDKDW